jgi:hypothetical protein
MVPDIWFEPALVAEVVDLYPTARPTPAGS